MSWIVCIGAGPSQVPYIKLLKQWGYQVIATDRQPDAPGFEWADKKAIVSTYDAEQSWVFVREQLNGEQAAGVIAPCTGEPLRTENYIKRSLGLKALTPDVVKNLLHKGLFREQINSISTRPLSYLVVETKAETEEAAGQIEYPVIVKPARGGMGGRGVSLVNAKSELINAFEDASWASLTGEVVFERYVYGKEYNVTALLYQGDFLVFVIGRALKDNRLNEVPVGEVIGPDLLPPAIVSKIKDLLLSACQVFQLENATLNVDIIIDSSEIAHIIEIEFAFANAFDLLTTACNYDLRVNALHVMLNLKPDRINSLESGAAKRYFIHPVDEFKEVEGCEVVEALDGVVRLNFEEDVRVKLETSGKVAFMRGHVLVKGRNSGHAEQIVDQVIDLLEFIYPAVVLIGMGDHTVTVVNKAKQAGLFVICANRNPNARVFDHADVSLVLDGKDIESLLAYILTDNRARGFVGAYSGSDLFLTVANILQAEGHDNLSIRAAFAAQNKAACKLLWQRSGVNTPKAWMVKGLKEYKAFKDNLPIPCVVKPADANSSRGIRQCDSLEEIEPAVKAALSWSTIGKALIEPFISGRMLDINAFFNRGNFYRAGVVERWSGGPPFFAVDRAECPANLTMEEEDAVYDLFKQAALAIGITDGPVKADILLTEDGPYILEVAPRFHGVVASLYLIPLALGIDAYKYFFERMKSKRLYKDAFQPSINHFAVAKTIQVPDGRIKSIERLEEAQRILGIESVLWQKKIGDRVRSSAESNEDIVGYVIAKAEDRASVKIALKDFFSTLEIKIE